MASWQEKTSRNRLMDEGAFGSKRHKLLCFQYFADHKGNRFRFRHSFAPDIVLYCRGRSLRLFL